MTENKGKLIELLAVLLLGSIVLLMLLKICFTTLKPITHTIEKYEKQQTEQTKILDEVIDND